jgi:hypothetical protein
MDVQVKKQSISKYIINKLKNREGNMAKFS